jgi:hypothetical protein
VAGRPCRASELFDEPGGGSCGPGGTIVVHDADRWRGNVVALAWAAQHNIPVWPIIFQAGCKSPTLEYQADSVRISCSLSDNTIN